MVGSRGVGKGDGAWVALCRQILRDLASPPPPPTLWFSCILSVDADDFLGVFIFIISSFFFPLALCSVSFMIFFPSLRAARGFCFYLGFVLGSGKCICICICIFICGAAAAVAAVVVLVGAIVSLLYLLALF